MNIKRQFLRFVAVGLVNTTVGLGAIFALKWLAGLGDYAANFLGYCIGLLLSYVLNSRWTFRAPVLDGPRALRFLAAFALAYGANVGLLATQIELLGVNEYLAQTVSVAAYTTIFFLACRWFVYSPRRVSEPVADR